MHGGTAKMSNVCVFHFVKVRTGQWTVLENKRKEQQHTLSHRLVPTKTCRGQICRGKQNKNSEEKK